MIAAAELAPEAVWPVQAADAQLALNVAADTARAGSGCDIDAALLVEQTGLFRLAAFVAVKDHEHDSSKTGRKLAAIARRIRDRIDDYLRFSDSSACATPVAARVETQAPTTARRPTNSMRGTRPFHDR